ncbi:histidine kinase [Actinosynnema sp. NPDC023587]|uniref:sensor histidine kinase n=1 Tax=Actinosynnema sp. NPDC023587 TaxID=3154695 RepID=UPI0033ED8670
MSASTPPPAATPARWRDRWFPPPDPAVRAPRTTRDWVVDTACFLLASAFGLITARELRTQPELPDPLVVVDQVIGAAGCAALWLRRRWPVALALALVALSTFSMLVQGAAAVALFAVAVHRSLPVVAAVGGVSLLLSPIYSALRPDPGLTYREMLIYSALVYLAVTGWGVSVRARRHLVESLRERAAQAEVEAQRRIERAERLERDRIAREVHDVLAHRLSLLSLYAGALEYRSDMTPAEVARAAAVIRDSSHKALQDVREVIGVLRAPVGYQVDPGDRPTPTLAGLPDLVEESRRAGVEVEVRDVIGELDAVPDAVGRTAYRVVQEGLTNARKHAAGLPVAVRLSGAPGVGLEVEVRNPIPQGTAAPEVPGGRQGLVGLAERAALAGGRLEHGPAGGDHRLWAWLPWEA